MTYHYCVVTWVPEDDEGNLALAFPIYVQESNLARPISVMEYDAHLFRELRAPVFTLGEILILDEDRREVSGKLRKPGKWIVKTESFSNLEDAVKRAKEILESHHGG